MAKGVPSVACFNRASVLFTDFCTVSDSTFYSNQIKTDVNRSAFNGTLSSAKHRLHPTSAPVPANKKYGCPQEDAHGDKHRLKGRKTDDLAKTPTLCVPAREDWDPFFTAFSSLEPGQTLELNSPLSIEHEQIHEL